jgi:hypothetical protein
MFEGLIGFGGIFPDGGWLGRCGRDEVNWGDAGRGQAVDVGFDRVQLLVAVL